MGAIRNVALGVLAISFLTFVAFFGRLPTFRNTPIGFLHRLVWIYIPRGLRRLDHAISGGRLSSSLARTGDYLMNEKHPLVLIFFLGLLTAAAGAFIVATWHDLSTIHHFLLLILVPLPYIYTYLCASYQAHYITPSNHAQQMVHYPFDHILFHPGQICRTCLLEKPARSKHCSICKACVARSDHHCIWVNTCLGRGNYKYFIYLLISITVLLIYGVYLTYVVLSPLVREHFTRWPAYHTIHLPTWAVNWPWPLSSMAEKVFRAADVLTTAMQVSTISIAAVGLLALMTAPLPLGLLLYHVYLIWAGTTTNESAKWSDWRDDMDDGCVFLGHIKSGSEVDTAALRSPWPVRSRQILLRTSDGEAPRTLPGVVAAVVDESRGWERVWKLSTVENLYDLGWWENLREVLKN